MALRKILTVGEPTLRKISRKVTAFDEKLHALLDDMAETLYDADGVGLAAPQIGILRRIVLVDTGEGLFELINPEIMETAGEQDGLEGCLSVPGEYGLVKRPNYVKLRAQDRDGNWYEVDGEGLIARAFCHEYDHLDGRLYTEIAHHMLSEEELAELHTNRSE
ncbi:MAG: peptide deformylase [Oscillospiraceae bacterium]|jgi:peptide deformylase|nr:peptide deformylase [Oscillospiraceae bacterium]